MAIYSVCFLFLLMTSCKKSDLNNDNPSIPGTPFEIPAASPVNGSVFGRIVDENEAAVAGASIACAGKTAITDANGFFSIEDAILDKYISTVTVMKPGYFKGYRSFSATADRNYVNIKLIPKLLSATIASASAQTVTLANNTEINFQANSMVMQSNGATYNGPVNVYASYIDPTQADIHSRVPGSFLARDNNNMYLLRSTGMISVDIETAAGEPLQLLSGKPANIKLLIPASVQSIAPATIDTWSLDENGVWKKESTASRVGNFYDMEVSHFSFWNTDYPCNIVFLNLHVQDQNGMNVANSLVQLTALNPNELLPTTSGITDASGNVAGFVPVGRTMELRLYSTLISTCSVPLYTQNIGPFSSNASLTISPSLTPQQLFTVSGIANNCAGQPLSSGTALIYTGGGEYYQYTDINNGNYSASLVLCTQVSTFYVVLFDSSLSAQSIVGPLSISGNNMTIPPTSLCSVPINQFDGIYNVTGTLTDFANPAFAGDYPRQYHLISSGPWSVTVAQDVNGEIAPAYMFSNAGAGTFYGSFGIEVFFDPSNNQIFEVRNYYGVPFNAPNGVGNPATGTGAPQYASANGRAAVLNTTGINNYNPATRVIRIKYDMMQPQVVPVGPRATIEETLTYIGPR